MTISNNRLQVFDYPNGDMGKPLFERISIGNVNGDNTIYGFRIRGADGNTLLIDETGVKREGITDGSINNAKIGSDANISGAKLDIASVIVSINNGTTTINGSKIYVDNTTLDLKISSINSTESNLSSRMTTAETNINANATAISLKASQTDLNTTNSNVTTAINTANAKKRVFTAQPTTPYDIGDLWSQGIAGDLMTCTTARASGAYTASDWTKASKYTDDTTANAVQSNLNTTNTNVTNLTTRMNNAEVKITPDAIVSTVSNSVISSNTAITIIDNGDSNILYSGTWTSATNVNDYGGGGKYSNTTNNYIQYTFIGTGINVYFEKFTNKGIARIYIDGVDKGTIDLYNATALYKQKLYTITGLTYDEHIIKIVVTGTKNASATDTQIYFDYFEVTNTIAVNVNNILSQINQSAEAITINASKINLSGYVTFTNLGTAGAVTINGGNITAGTLDCSKITVTNLSANSITGGTISGIRIKQMSGNTLLADLYTNPNGGMLDIYDQWGYLYVSVGCQNGDYSNIGGEIRIFTTNNQPAIDMGALNNSTNGIIQVYDSTGYVRSKMDGGGFYGIARRAMSTWTGTVPVNGDVFINHNLGYYPIISISGTCGNVIMTYAHNSVNQLRLSNYNNGWSGTVYFW